MAPRCEIIFDNPLRIYFVGETISGKIEIILDKPTKIKGVLLHVKGEAMVIFTEKRGPNSASLSNHEQYFEFKHYVVGGKMDEEFILLPTGINTYNFSFSLPLTLPSSFEVGGGGIGYTIEAIIERPWKFNINTLMLFTVVSHYDLNKSPNLLSPVKKTSEKYFQCCFRKSGPLVATLQIPRSGFISNDTIPVTIEIDNASNVNIGIIKLKLQQLTTLSAKNLSGDLVVSHAAALFREMRLGKVDKHRSITHIEMLPVPNLPPTDINQCAIMKSEYQILLEIIPKGYHEKLKLSIPITIGTMPFIGLENTIPPKYQTGIKFGTGTSQTDCTRAASGCSK